MAVDGIKPKVTNTIAPPTIEPKKVESAKLEKAFEPIAKKASEGFDTLKKKLVSVTGGFRAHKPIISDREDLKASISGQRSALAANGGTPTAISKGAKRTDAEEGGPQAEGTLNTASSKGKDPAARKTDSDFAGKAAGTPGVAKGDVDSVANAAARTALQNDFGVKVKDGDKKWSTEELSRAHESFATMPKADQEKLRGLDLIRSANAPPESQAEMGTKGTVAGEYSPNVATKDGNRVKPGSISLYDAAFPAGNGTASRKSSMHVILHEAGHAVEGRSRDEAMVAANKATDVSNAAVGKLNPASEANNAQWGVGKNPGANTTNGAMHAFGTVKTNDKPGMAFMNAQRSVSTAIDKLQTAKTPEEISKAQTALDGAKAKRDTALKGMSGHDKESAASSWVGATDKQEKTARAYADANAVYVPAKAASNAANTALAGVATETVKDGKTISTSKEVAAFSKARGSEAQVSSYGASKTGEGYAEAYALYQRDPATMKKDFPNQYKFFHKNHQSADD